MCGSGYSSDILEGVDKAAATLYNRIEIGGGCLLSGAPIVKMERVPCADGYHSIGAVIIKRDEGETYHVTVMKNSHENTESIVCESLCDMLGQYDKMVEKYKDIR